MKLLMVFLATSLLTIAFPTQAQQGTHDLGDYDCSSDSRCPDSSPGAEVNAARTIIAELTNCTGHGQVAGQNEVCHLINFETVKIKLVGAHIETWCFGIFWNSATETVNLTADFECMGVGGGGPSPQKFFVFTTTTCVGTWNEYMAPATFAPNDQSYKVGDVNDTAPNPFGFCYTTQHAGGQ